MVLAGGCLCGNVRYQVEGKIAFTALCHCTHCQKQSGSAFSIIVGVPSGALSVQGEIATYEDRGDSGAVLKRQFCPKCGSPLFSVGEGAPAVTFVKAGTLDDCRALSPQIELWTKSEQPWLKLELAAKRFARQPA